MHQYLAICLIAEEIVKCHVKDCFQINGKQTVKIPKKGEYVRLKHLETKIKSLLRIYTYFESILVPEDISKQNPK